MQLMLPGDDDPRRAAVRDWIAAHPDPTREELADAGFVAPSWPRPWGLGADVVHILVIHDEFRRAGIKLPKVSVGVGWAGPTLLHGGTPEQQQRYLPPMLAGHHQWCQLFSEPDAGSDLAALATRATRSGDSYIVRGQKVWSSYADKADYGILIARTDPDVPKHKGISFFVLPMDLPGVTIRPIIDMAGGHHFNEVFLDDVELPVDHLVGEENGGWSLTRLTLANERIALSGDTLCWSLGPTNDEFFDMLRDQGGVSDPVLRQRVADAFIRTCVLRFLDHRVTAAALQGQEAGPETSVKKLLADVHGQLVMDLAKDLAGTDGLLTDRGPLGADVGEWHWGFLFSRALTIGGGTAEMQRNIIAERLLGMPREPDPTVTMPWARRTLAAQESKS